MLKKNWTKPKLIVLVRARPDEAVLLGCKTDETTAGPDATQHYVCRYATDIIEDGNVVGREYCDVACSTIGLS